MFPPPPGASRQQVRYADYRAAVHYPDTIAGGVIADLERRGLLDQTVVIVTSDHGNEFDETGQGFTGHGTAYSAMQLRTPFLPRWPGRPPRERLTPHVASRRRADAPPPSVQLREPAVGLQLRPRPPR
jgi:membrane-anchored protein YejM (alkaline phosphatase superfamily)